MSVQSVLQEVRTWPVEEQLAFYRGIEDQLYEEGILPNADLDEERARLLDARIDAHEAKHGPLLTWEELEERRRGRITS